MNRLFPLFLVSFFFVFISCNSNEIGKEKDVDPESIYFDYQVRGEEGDDNVTVLLQYRFAGENGTTLTIDEPGKVEMDGEIIEVDSSKITGAYYELQRPVSTFEGKHRISFTNREGKKYTEEFVFGTLSLTPSVPDTIQRGPIVFQLNGLAATDKVRVLMTDTSFHSEGVNRLETVRNGQIVIDESDLLNLANGPIQLQLIKETEHQVKNGTMEGGRISISYGLKREFILKN